MCVTGTRENRRFRCSRQLFAIIPWCPLSFGAVREVFQSYELLGWYSTATEVESSDMAIHQTIMQFNESPVYVRLDPSVKPDQKELPVFAYQAEFHARDTAGGAATTVFVRMPLRIDAVESERITVDAISDSRREDDSRSSCASPSSAPAVHVPCRFVSPVLLCLFLGLCSGATH